MGEGSVVAVGTGCPMCAWQQNSGAFIWSCIVWVPGVTGGVTQSVSVGQADAIWGLG